MNQINKYFLYISLIFNGGLLIYLFGAIPFFLFFSAVTNASLLWYIKKILDKSIELEEDIIDAVNKIEIFSNHIEQIHELEMYYGDENLQKLMEHSNELVNDFIDFQEKHFDVEVHEAQYEPEEPEEVEEEVDDE
tara:strand:+ start:927 stop:1331 length:405 start_codon:yes stop_codon:yes gene_type:complete